MNSHLARVEQASAFRRFYDFGLYAAPAGCHPKATSRIIHNLDGALR